MGTVINFPEARRVERDAFDGLRVTATIMILPVVRIERPNDRPPDEVTPAGVAGTRKRRRRARRS
jgi:hypothetical protein